MREKPTKRARAMRAGLLRSAKVERLQQALRLAACLRKMGLDSFAGFAAFFGSRHWLQKLPVREQLRIDAQIASFRR